MNQYTKDLIEHQIRFCRMLARLIDYAESLGYGLAPACAKCFKEGHHRPGSLHYIGLAQDYNLFIKDADGELEWRKDPESHRPLGEFWESIGGTWGGRFSESSPGAGDGVDSNHYSLTFRGIK